MKDANGVLHWEMAIDGVFVAIGHTPNTKVFEGIHVDEKDLFCRNMGLERILMESLLLEMCKMIAICRQLRLRGFGCMAALDIERYLRK